MSCKCGKYVGLVQQGMITDQRVITKDDDRAKVQAAVDAAAKKLNDAQTGFGEGWTAVVLSS